MPHKQARRMTAKAFLAAFLAFVAASGQSHAAFEKALSGQTAKAIGE